MLEGCLAWDAGGLIVIEMSKGGVACLKKKGLAWEVGGLIVIEMSKSGASE